MQKYLEIFENRIPARLETPWIKENIHDMLSGKASSMDIYRWKSGTCYPPVDMLIKLAEIINQPTAYLIGQTDVQHKIERTKASPRDLKELMEQSGMSIASLSKAVGTTRNTMTDLISKFPNIRTNSLIAIAEALDVSTDYLLGLTDHRKWEEFEPFVGISPGEPVFVTDEGQTEEGEYCLLGFDGKTLYLADGSTRDTDDYKGRLIYPARIWRKK